MKKNNFQKVMLASLGVMLIGTSVGLSTSKLVSADSANGVDTKDTLKVLYWNTEAFNRTYGEQFSKNYPNTDIEVVALEGTGSVMNYNSAIEKYSPDLVMLPPQEYQQMSKDKKLTDLEPLIKRDQYDMTTVYPGLLEELKKQGGGNLYGLSHKANSYALLYNVDLFKKNNVQVPSDGSTWEEILALASKFPTTGDQNNRIWGLHSFGTDNLAMDIARTEGLTYLDPNTQKVTVDTAEWKNAYHLAVEATKSGVLDERVSLSSKNYLESNSFVVGRAAMTVASISQLQDLQEAKNKVKNYKPFTLGMVAGPAASKDRKSTGNVYVNEIFAIPAGASNVDTAWNFIKYTLGDDFAKEYYAPNDSNNDIGAPLSRMVKEFSGYKLDAFYKLTPNLDRVITNDANPNQYHDLEWEFWTLLQEELSQVVKGKKTLDVATAAVQTRTQAIADTMAKDQQAKK